MSAPRGLIVGISGATGVVYGLRVLELLREAEIETHLVITRAGDVTRAHELPHGARELRALASVHHPITDIGAPIASGSFRTMGMIVAPCSVRTLAEIATGVTGNLLSRAADVVLKERRRLVLLFRETPLQLGHIRNMLAVTEAGGIVMPPVPAFYGRPTSIDAMVPATVGRALDLFGIETGRLERWGEDLPTRPPRLRAPRDG